MTQGATTSLSLHYRVKPGQKEEALVEMKGMLDRCAKEPEFIMAIIHETPERPNEIVFYERTARASPLICGASSAERLFRRLKRRRLNGRRCTQADGEPRRY